METLTTALVYLSTIPLGFQWIILLLISIIAIRNLLDYQSYKEKRRFKTTNVVMSFTESILSNILADSIQNMRQIMIDARGGELTQDDRTELNLCRLASANSLLIETKHKVKSILIENGYYRLVKEDKQKDLEILTSQRAQELREISRSNIDSLIRTSSPLQGVSEARFSMENSVTLFRSIVNKHVTEIDIEVADIEAYGRKKLWIFYNLMKYIHDDE